MKAIYRRLLIFVVAILVIAGGYFGYRLYATLQRGVPQEFSSARSQGSAISEKIISNSNDIATLVARLSSPTSTYIQASTTLGEVLAKVGEVHDQAIELSTTIETMTKAVKDIRIAEAQQAALQSISQRLALVGRLISYTNDVNQLTVAIRLRMEHGVANTKEINQLVRQINSGIAAANSLSSLADESMAKFDALLR